MVLSNYVMGTNSYWTFFHGSNHLTLGHNCHLFFSFMMDMKLRNGRKGFKFFDPLSLYMVFLTVLIKRLHRYFKNIAQMLWNSSLAQLGLVLWGKTVAPLNRMSWMVPKHGRTDYCSCFYAFWASLRVPLVQCVCVTVCEYWMAFMSYEGAFQSTRKNVLVNVYCYTLCIFSFNILF